MPDDDPIAQQRLLRELEAQLQLSRQQQARLKDALTRVLSLLDQERRS